MTTRSLLGSAVTCVAVFCLATVAFAFTPEERLGKLLYEDTNLSEPPGQSCRTCHHPNAGFADPLNRRDPVNWPVSLGADGVSVGGRNAPTAAYASYSPEFFSYVDGDKTFYAGGQFWDGRAATLADQAKGPFLAEVEMNNTEEGVVSSVLAGNYARLFRQVCVQSPVSRAYDCIANAIAAYESTQILLKFDSKYDAYLAKAEDLTVQEARGMDLFNDPLKGNCAACHPSTTTGVIPPLFTYFTYDNLGIPPNPQVEALRLAAELPYTIDLGLGGRSDIENTADQYGKFKVPTLRNVAKTAPYGHNGYFATLYEFVGFLNTRANWPAAEVADNLNTVIGNLGLSTDEVEDIVAFLLTLSDGEVVHAQ